MNENPRPAPTLSVVLLCGIGAFFTKISAFGFTLEREMRDVLRGRSDFEVAAHLGHHDRGVRLAAYAYLNEHEDPEHFRALVHTVVAEDKPFNQYWGLLAVTHQLSAARLDDDLRRELGAMRDRIRRDTDRARILDGILG